MKDVTFLIKTFDRPECLDALLVSLRKFYPETPVLVADDGKNAVDRELPDGTKIYALPFDSGLSAGRNFLLTKVETKYFCILDDDFIFTKDTDIEHLRKMLGQHKLDLAAGSVREKGEIKHYEGHFKFENRVLTYVEGKNESGRYELVFNFFIAKVEKIMDLGGWDDDLKLAEHSDFFFRNRGKLKIGYFPEVIVDHTRVRTPEYNVFRQRGTKFFQMFMKKQGISRVVNFVGDSTDARADGHAGLSPFTVCITHFERKLSLERLVLSIARFYPEATIQIADCSEKFDRSFYARLWEEAGALGLVNRGVAWCMKHDSGLSAMRNHLAHNAKTPFLLYLEDDFEWTENTDPFQMLAPFKDPSVAVVGGAVREADGIVNFHGRFRRENHELYLEKSDDPNFVLNFIMVRKRALIDIPWDNDLKIAEHMDFFYRLSLSNWTVRYLPSTEIFHHRDRDPEYSKYRARLHDFLVKAMEKHGLKRVIQFGKVMEVTSVRKIKTYRLPQV